MKITTSQLKRIIREELSRINESGPDAWYGSATTSDDSRQPHSEEKPKDTPPRVEIPNKGVEDIKSKDDIVEMMKVYEKAAKNDGKTYGFNIRRNEGGYLYYDKNVKKWVGVAFVDYNDPRRFTPSETWEGTVKYDSWLFGKFAAEWLRVDPRNKYMGQFG